MPRVYSYNFASKGAKTLSKALGWPRICHQASKFRGNFKPWVLNWGGLEMPPHVRACKVINPPEAIHMVNDKLEFFRLLEGQGLTPKWWTDRAEVEAWMAENEGKLIVARTVLRGHGGQGIHISDHPLRLPNAPLYVRYMKKKEEYRVHVFDNQVIDVQQKKRRLEVPDDQVDWRVRNHSRGFVYARENVEAPACVLGASLTAMRTTDLTFGAVDVIWNESKDRAYVLEINSAPGLEGSTVEKYVEAIKNFIVRK